MPLTLSLVVNQTASGGELSYFSPRGRTTEITAIHVTNPTTVEQSFRLALVVGGGAATDPDDYVFYDVPVGPKDTFTQYPGWVLAPKDRLFIEDGSNALSFTANGRIIS